MRIRRLRPQGLLHGLTLTLALLPAVTVLPGCQHQEDPASEATQAATAHTYSVRGVVRQLPQAGQAGVPFLIQPEASDDYISVSGKPAPMAAMTMPFMAADGVDLEALAVGDKIAFELRVDWQASAAMLISSIEKLPPETVLDLPGD